MVDFGEIKKGEILKGSFTIENSSKKELEPKIINEDSTFVFKIESNQNENYKIHFSYNTNELNGFVFKTLFLGINGFEEQLELFITAEITP